MRARVVRPEADGGAVAGDRRVQAALLLQDVAQVGVVLGFAGIARDRLADQVHGEVAAAGLVGDHAEQMQAVGMPGIGGQDLAEQALRVVEAAGLLVGHGGGEQRPNGRRGCGGGTGRRLVRPGLVAIHGGVVGCGRAHKVLRDSPLSKRDKPNW